MIAGAPAGEKKQITDLGEDADDGLGRHLGALPTDVLKLVIVKLDGLSRALFARAAGACWRAVKDARLSCRICLLYTSPSPRD